MDAKNVFNEINCVGMLWIVQDLSPSVFLELPIPGDPETG